MTAMLGQMQERLHSIAQDMYILNRSCGEEIVRSSLARARKAAPKKRRRARRRNRVRPVKQACSDTFEESISSTDEVTLQRKRARVYKGSPPSATTQSCSTPPSTSLHLHITTFHSNNSTSHRTITSVAPFLGLFSPVFGSKQIKQASAMSTFVLRLRLPC